jgi:hypothetical protein
MTRSDRDWDGEAKKLVQPDGFAEVDALREPPTGGDILKQWRRSDAIIAVRHGGFPALP